MGKKLHHEKLPLQKRPIHTVGSYGDEQRRPINSLVLSLGNSRVLLVGCLYICVCVCVRVVSIK